jgi:hypothetical protein
MTKTIAVLVNTLIVNVHQFSTFYLLMNLLMFTPPPELITLVVLSAVPVSISHKQLVVRSLS